MIRVAPNETRPFALPVQRSICELYEPNAPLTPADAPGTPTAYPRIAIRAAFLLASHG